MPRRKPSKLSVVYRSKIDKAQSWKELKDIVDSIDRAVKQGAFTREKQFDTLLDRVLIRSRQLEEDHE